MYIQQGSPKNKKVLKYKPTDDQISYEGPEKCVGKGILRRIRSADATVLIFNIIVFSIFMIATKYIL